jgi:spore coat polysaccharide biosynthesis protein SpsF (cytidylyltransferase family)
VFRGPLDDVFGRFRGALEAFPCRWFFRICADSPLLDASLFGRMLAHAARDDLDLVTNVFPRTFPKGQSLEMVSAPTFAGIDVATLSPALREHVTKVFYERAEAFRILNVTADAPAAGEDLALDSLEDLRRLEAWGRKGDGA